MLNLSFLSFLTGSKLLNTSTPPFYRLTFHFVVLVDVLVSAGVAHGVIARVAEFELL